MNDNVHLPIALAALLMTTAICRAQAPPSAQRPLSPGELLVDLDFRQRLGNQIPLDAEFRDETGATVKLRNFFGERPVVLALVYYECPMLCTQILSGMIDALGKNAFDPGREYEVVIVSISPTESPALAAEKKRRYLESFGRAHTAGGWHFLTGQNDAIAPLAEAVGYRYRYDPVTRQYAHPSGIMVLTPAGQLSHYLYGITYSTRDLRLALVEAADNKIGSPVDQLLLFCFSYDPSTGKYSMAILNAVRLGGIITVLLLLGFIGFSLFREHRRRKRAPGMNDLRGLKGA